MDFKLELKFGMLTRPVRLYMLGVIDFHVISVTFDYLKKEIKYKIK